MFATAGTGAKGTPTLGHGAAVTGLVAANLYIVAFAMSWGPVMWARLGGMFPVTVTFLPLLSLVTLAGAYALYALAAALLSVAPTLRGSPAMPSTSSA